jgi:beta-mannosidase
MGFMVWQEFIQSSSGIDNIPSKIESFLINQAKTANWATKHLRNHPSLAVWSGGNELMSDVNIPSNFADRNLGELLGVVTQHSPHIPMLPTSASGPSEMLHRSISYPGENHDIHGGWTFLGVVDHYTRYNKSDSLFHSEFGVDGMTCLDSLKKFLSEENLKPTDMQENFVWRHHGEWWDVAFRDKAIFGESETLEQMIARSQYVQAEGLRYIIEANRRRAFRNSGSIIWQINEPYPNVSCTALIDYYMQPKPVFWQVAKAFAPLNVSLKYDKLIWGKGEEFTAEVYVSLDGEAQEVEYSYTADGQTVTGKVLCGNTQGIKVGDIKLIADGKYIDVTLNAKAADGKTFANTIRLLVKQDDGFCADDGLYDFYDKVNA